MTDDSSITGSSIFGVDDPFALTRAWLDEAAASEIADPNAMALSTVSADGMPNVRIVLLKGIEDDAFVFYTNYDSAKSQELTQSGKAAFVLHWKTLKRQVRVQGEVSREDGAKADAYYNSRPLDSRQTLSDAVETARARFGDNPPRPPFWGGFRIKPVRFEFWADGAFRLHDRESWGRGENEPDWTKTRLYP